MKYAAFCLAPWTVKPGTLWRGVVSFSRCVGMSKGAKGLEVSLKGQFVIVYRNFWI